MASSPVGGAAATSLAPDPAKLIRKGKIITLMINYGKLMGLGGLWPLR